MGIIRNFTALAVVPLLISGCSGFTTDSVAMDSSVAEVSFYSFSAESLEGPVVALSEYRGQVTLVVNTASQCGFTKQYKELQELQGEYAARGFSVLGFPSGDFGGQEFDTPGEIREFCDSKFGVTFPLFAKTKVKEGEGQSELYSHLGKCTGSLPGWNFGKYLVDRDGRVLAFYASPVNPTGEELRSAIEAALGRS
jgi:glutathione peroxidase